MKEFLSKNTFHKPPFEIWNGKADPHDETPKRMVVIEKIIKQLPKSQVVYPQDFAPMSIDLLKEIHSPKYIDYLFNLTYSESENYRYPSVFPHRRSCFTEQPNGKLGYFSFDLYTPVNIHLPAAAFIAARGAYSATLAVLDGDKTAYAIGRPPGHHAGYDFMGGYCYINNAAVAAKTLSRQGKVGILDTDFHHGNGTEDIFRVLQENESDPIFLHISIHANGNWKFPYFSGQTTGTDDPLWKGINYALREGTTDDQYDQILEQSLERLSDFKPDFLVIPVGFDTHENDPIGGFKLTTSYYEKMSTRIMSLNLPTVFIQEGGYNLKTIGDNITSFIRGIENSI